MSMMHLTITIRGGLNGLFSLKVKAGYHPCTFTQIAYFNHVTRNLHHQLLKTSNNKCGSHNALNHGLCSPTRKRNIYQSNCDEFYFSRKKAEEKIINIENFHKKTFTSFQKDGIKEIGDDKLQLLLYTINDNEQLKSSFNILKMFQEENIKARYRVLLSCFLDQCIILKSSSSMAKTLMNHSFFQSHITNNLTKRYYEILYENEEYQNIVDDIANRYDKQNTAPNCSHRFDEEIAKSNSKKQHTESGALTKNAADKNSPEGYNDRQAGAASLGVPKPFVTLFLVAALGKIGTYNSLSNISLVKDNFEENSYSHMRSNVIYSWIAFKYGKFDIVNDIISKRKHLSFNRYYFNLELAMLLENKNIDQIIVVLERLITSIEKLRCNKDVRTSHFVVCCDTILKLIDLTKEKAADRTKHVAEMSELLASYEVMSCETLEKLIFEPIPYTKSRNYKSLNLIKILKTKSHK